MIGISDFSIKRPVAALMIIITMVFAGFMTMRSLPTALLPDFDIPVVLIQTTWVGASPEDMDKLVTKEIEDAITTVKGIDTVSAYSNQDYSFVVVKFDYGYDNSVKQREVQTEIDKILKNLPDDADPPIVSKVDVDAEPVIIYSLTGTDLIELYNVADIRIKPRLEKIEGVGEITITGGLEEEILVEINPETLNAHHININTIKELIKISNINIPSGVVKYGDKEYTLRINGELESLDDVKNIIIQNKNGNILRLKDVATISLTTKDIEGYARRNGRESLQIAATKAKGGNAVYIATKVKEEMENLKKQLPSNLIIDVEYDSSINIKNSIGSVKDNAISGLILASIILMIFLKNIRATLIVAIAIPVSIIFTFFFLGLKGITLNIISLMGLALGVGMLVDNSIVVIDNIFRHMTELKKTRVQAARDGANEMMMPILASTATTVAVFLPIVFQNGIAKEIFQDLSYSISFALLSSFIIAVTFIPMAASKFFDENTRIDKEGAIMKWLKYLYKRSLKKLLEVKKIAPYIYIDNRIIVVIVTILIFIGSQGLFKKYGVVSFMPEQDESYYSIIAKPANGLNIEKVNNAALKIEEIVKNDKNTLSYSITVKKDGIAIQVEVPKRPDRINKASLKEITAQIRPKIVDIKDMEIEVKEKIGRGPSQQSVGTLEIKLFGDDYDELIKISEDYKALFSKEPNFVDIGSTYNGGLPQAKIDIDRIKADYYGLSVSEIAMFVAYQVRGEETVAIKTGTKEIDVTVRLEESRRNKLQDILELEIPSKFGFIKLQEIATVNTIEGPSQIRKEDKQKVISVGFNFQNIDMGRAVERINEIASEYNFPAGVTYQIGGDFKERAKVFGQLGFALMIGIFLIYFILAVQFESFVTPFIVMGTVPLAVIGVFIGMLITNTPFDIMVMVGIIMLAGIVVNNAIVLIDYVNLLKERGAKTKNALVKAGETRLRPILMTTLTTVVGMIPLAMGIGEGSEFYKGMAIAVTFGLSVATLLTLVFIPVILSLMESTIENIKKIFIRNKERAKSISERLIDKVVEKKEK